ncbi:MAG: RNA polymerase sigma factor RpoD/SigA [Leptospiraceae bacterium]|nr:RNA polymerase sigma factor RpoD/SigA [Leptospiraceae bacterium]
MSANTATEYNLYTNYTNEIHKIPMLSREEEKELATQAYQGDQPARDRLVQANLRFVVSIASKYKVSGLNQMDLINEGNLGLIKAAERFNPEMGYHFISYAVWWIKQSILYAIQQKAHAIRIPLNRSAELKRLKSAENWLANNGGESEVTIAEMADLANVKLNEASHLLQISREQISLDAPVANAEEGSLLDSISDSEARELDYYYTSKELQNELQDCLKVLTKKELYILELRFGLNNKQPHSLQKIGGMLKLSKERIRQIEKKALLKMRNSKLASQLKAYLDQ